MTSDEIKKVREAADIVLGRFGCHRADCRDCAKFVFSLVGTDGDEPVTEEWLREVWGWITWLSNDLVALHLDKEKRFSVRHIKHLCASCTFEDNGRFLCRLTTRYQFRLLAAALGIKRKGE